MAMAVSSSQRNVIPTQVGTQATVQQECERLQD